VATATVERAPFLRRWRSFRVVVEDTSMEPALAPGDRLWVDRSSRTTVPAVGVVVVLPDPGHSARWLVKRVAAVGPAAVYVRRSGVEVRPTDHSAPPPDDAIDRAELAPGHLYVLSDGGSGGRDSRTFGPVPSTSILGVVWWRYAPGDRVGPI
jgi:signal peptidase I